MIRLILSAFLLILTLPAQLQAICPQPTDTVTTSAFTNSLYYWDKTEQFYSTSTSASYLDSECTLHLLQLTVYETTVVNERIFTCGPYYWDISESFYNTSGVYSHTVTGLGGDTEYILTLTIDDSYGSTPGTNACSDYAWHELELPIDWEASAIDMNGAGDIVALGNRFGGSNGEVRVYQWTAGGWSQMGNTLEGLQSGANFGHDVSLSKNGKYLAVGAPYHKTADDYNGAVQVYEWNGSDWQIRGELIEAINIYDELGAALDLNNDGSVLAIGAPASGRVDLQTGEVRMYQWTGADYEQFGDHIYINSGTSIPDNNGCSVALSGDGLTVMFGGRFAQHSRYNVLGGMYAIYDWNGTAWEQREHFEGYRASMQLGYSVTISEDGQNYASGAMTDRSNAGMIFSNLGSLGQIHSDESGDQMGRSVSMNADGDVLAVGLSGNDDADETAGKVQVYRYDGSDWVQLGDDITGTEKGEFFGFQLQMNDAGNVMAVGTFGGTTNTGLETHIYYYGCAETSASCSNTVIYEENNWSNTTGPADGDIVHIKDDLIIDNASYMPMAGLTVHEGVQLTVEEGVTLDVAGDFKVDGQLTVESGGSLISYQQHDFDGEVTFRRNSRYAGDRYSFVGTPVMRSADNPATTAALGPIVYRYNEYTSWDIDGENKWFDASDGYLVAPIGYAVAGQKTIELTGVPNIGEMSFYCSYTEDATTTSDNWGWNLLSNPYGAALDIEKFLAHNTAVKGFVALWDDHGSHTGRGTNSDYLIANAIGSVAGPNGGQFNGYIGTMQGFMVQMDGVGSRVYFTEDMRASGNNADGNFFREGDDPMAKIKLKIATDDGLYSETLIGFPEEATSGYDRLYDATRLKSQTDFNIYSLLDDQAMAIQGLPLSNEVMIPLGMDLGESGTVHFTVENTDEISERYVIELIDQYTGLSYLLDQDQSLTLQLTSGEAQERFTLMLKAHTVLSADELKTKNFNVYTDGDYIHVNGGTHEITSYQLISLSGQLADKSSVQISETEWLIPTGSLKGLYLLRLESTHGKEVHKLILK